MEKTAAELVQLVRTWTGYWNQAPYRDGFAADAVDADGQPNGPATILSMLNEAQRQLADTGYVKCDFNFAAVAGQLEYGADAWIGNVLSATWQGKPLRHTTIGQLDRERPGWRQQAPGTPREIYWYSDQVGVFPPPLVSDGVGAYSLVVRADALVAELAAEDDVPARLPARFHELLAIGAALFVSVADTENEAAARRVPWLQKTWNDGKKDLLQVIQQRELDQTDQIAPDEYRRWYRISY